MPTHMNKQLRFLLFLLCFPLSIAAQNSGDVNGVVYVMPSAMGTGDGSSWANAAGSLATVLQEAHTNTAIQQVWVAAGTYYPSSTNNQDDFFRVRRSNLKLYGGFTGEETSLSERDWAANKTILSGNIGNAASSEDNSYHIMVVSIDETQAAPFSPVDNSTVIDGFEFSDGNANAGSVLNNLFPRHSGSAMMITTWGEDVSCTPAIRNCVFKNNQAFQTGAVYIDAAAKQGSTDTLRIADCRFENNLAEYQGGGLALFNLADIGYDGANAFYNVKVTNTEFVGQSANNDSQGGPAGGIGGGVVATGRGYLRLDACTFRNNTSTNDGAAIGLRNGAKVAVTNSLLYNVSSNKPVIYAAGKSELIPDLKVYNTTLYNPDGIVLKVQDNVTTGLINSILWTDGAADAITVAGSTATGTAANSLIKTADVNNPASGFSASAVISAAPGFVNVAASDFRPSAMSPVINQGNSSLNTFALARDLSGGPRVVGSAIDMGAYEYRNKYFVAATASGANNGSTWADAYTDLQTAIDHAAFGDSLFVKKGVYNLTATISMKDSVKIYGSFAGTEEYLSQRVFGADSSILLRPATATANFRIVTNHFSEANPMTDEAVLDGFVLRGGHLIGNTNLDRGGGMSNRYASPTLSNLIISSNRTEAYGGGMYNGASTSVLTNVVIIGNVASDRGGGIANLLSELTLNNVTISRNTGPNWGGGIYNENSSPILNQVTISENNAIDRGGGIFGAYQSNPVLNNVVIRGNYLTGQNGIGQSMRFGGGMHNEVNCNPVLTNVLVSGNSAYNYGGGIANLNNCKPILTNVTISGNSAHNYGGGIYNDSSSPEIRNSIILGNSATYYNGIYNVTNSVPVIAFSLVEELTNTDNGNISSKKIDGADVTASEVFVNPDNSATYTTPSMAGDYHLITCSPAVNAADPVSTAAPTDITGYTRVGTYDLGAYEYQGPVGAAALAAHGATSVSNQQGTVYYGACPEVIARVSSNTTDGASGSTTAKLWIESTQPAQYVKRHYEITPATNGSGQVTLYFTQEEFDDFNAINSIGLPTGPGDASGIANLKIEKRDGQSSNGAADATGLPETYAGAITTVDPADTDIFWNSSLSRWEVSFNVTGFSGFFAKSTSDPLPVTLASFEAAKEGNAVLLNWKTTSEINSDFFAIERSTNGTAWETIGKIPAMNNSRVTQSYAFRDSSPRSGENIYRLKMTDRDASFTYSRMRSVTFQASDEVVLYPNPGSGPVQVRVSPRYIGSQATLIDGSGKVLKTISIAAENFRLNLNASGAYLLRMQDGQSVKVVKGH